MMAPSTHPCTDKPNYRFLLAIMAHQCTQILAAVLFTASLLFLAFLATGLAPFTVGAMLVGLGMFAAGASLFSLNRCADSKMRPMTYSNADSSL